MIKKNQHNIVIQIFAITWIAFPQKELKKNLKDKDGKNVAYVYVV